VIISRLVNFILSEPPPGGLGEVLVEPDEVGFVLDRSEERFGSVQESWTRAMAEAFALQTKEKISKV